MNIRDRSKNRNPANIIASEASSVTNCANLRFLVYIFIYLYIYIFVTVLAETNLTEHISETYIFIPLRSPSLVEHDKLFTFFIRLTIKKL